MKAQFYLFLTVTKFKILYVTCYQRKAVFLNNCINAMTLLVSVSSIAAWSVWSQLGPLWSILIGVAQVMQVIKPFLPFSDRLNALKYFLPDLQLLFTDAELIWNQMAKYDEVELADKLCQFRRNYLTIDNRYMGQLDIPESKRIHKTVTPEWERYFNPFYQRINKEDLQ